MDSSPSTSLSLAFATRQVNTTAHCLPFHLYPLPFLPSLPFPFLSLSPLTFVFLSEPTLPRVKQVARRGRYAALNATLRAAAPPLQPSMTIHPTLIDWMPGPPLGFCLPAPHPSQPPTRPAPTFHYNAHLTSLTLELAAIRCDYEDFLAQQLPTDEADSTTSPDAYSMINLALAAGFTSSIPAVRPVTYPTHEEGTA